MNLIIKFMDVTHTVVFFILNIYFQKYSLDDLWGL